MINLLYLAVAMAAGLALSRLMKLVNLPNVTGYLIAGILVGPYVLNIINTESIKSLKIITSTALGFIAFSIGGEFKLSYLKKLGKSIVVITVVQALVTVLLVAGVMLLIPGEKSVKVPRALLLGAISAATAPAATRAPLSTPLATTRLRILRTRRIPFSALTARALTSVGIR